ncbi:flagellar basal body P-ring formation chaperone FlgA [Cognatishimia sp. F0-27]|uniref:flagellar basal body P-ring formation chaperone FlgA n=1 Tax=Cognatishimia sp. F0-27 TaxID=2816855 RepID=UPI001D0C57EB|nr:flagellar basal body P-ring formation chaperone FlgA [Cognatishimia sp. F0-27]MCC1491220.1 flagellar basal body P-ring formation protein FlgA [Cognatishimia sp. F0-27]
MLRLAIFLSCLGGQLLADVVVATRTIRPQQVITDMDVRVQPGTRPGAHSDLIGVLGKEARVAIYPGRAVMRDAVTAPALVDRNQLVELVFAKGPLHIITEGRALGRGGTGDRIRVMNLSSRAVLFGTIVSNGTVDVTP